MVSTAFVLLLAVFAYTNASPLLIGAFNIQVFGQSKMDKPEVVEILIKIVQRYDIILIQEIRDSAETAFPELVDRVNAVSSVPYDFVVSERTGRTSSKEQYGYVFKSDVVDVVSFYQYPDNKDIFEREPSTVKFKRTDGGNQQYFSFTALHAKPSDAVAEIDALVEVYNIVEDIFGSDALIAGDFNADCSYVCSGCWDDIGLWTDQRFTWLIDSNKDTTVSNSDCAYDRLVVAGSSMTENSSGPKIFRYDQEYGLSQEEALDVSDHYPVEFYLE